MIEHPPISPEDSATVAEYALGLLPEAEATSFVARLNQEPALRAALANWQNDLATLTDEIDPVQPPAHLKAAVDQRLFPQATPNLWSRIGLWRGWALAATLTAAVLAALYFQPSETITGPFFVTEIRSENAEMQIAALYDPANNTLTLNRTKGGALPDRALELWLITTGNAPVSLGVMALSEQSRHSVTPILARALNGAALAISDEPLGGSPTGQPTGQVLATGALVQL